MISLLVIIAVVVATAVAYRSINKTPPPPTPKKPATQTGTGTASTAPPQNQAQNNQAVATTSAKWKGGWVGAIIGLTILVGVGYGGWSYGKDHKTPPPRWAFQYKMVLGQRTLADTYPAKIVRFDEIGDEIVFNFEVYFSDKDCGNYQTIFFEYDTRKGKSGNYHQSCPPGEGVWNFYQTGSRFNGTMKSSRLPKEVMFELYRVQ